MKLLACTVTVAVDAEHLEELRVSWPSWAEHHPELMAFDWLFLIDDDALRSGLKEIIGDSTTWWAVRVPDIPGANQREKMLTALVRLPFTEINTPWLIKLDTDTIGRASKHSWFKSADLFRYRMISHCWRYTRPASWVANLSQWGLRNLPHDRGPIRPFDWEIIDDLAYCPRIQSFVALVETNFAKYVADLCKDDVRLPVPSHDTMLWYVAQATGTPWLGVNMKNRGWDHGRKALRWERTMQERHGSKTPA